MGVHCLHEDHRPPIWFDAERMRGRPFLVQNGLRYGLRRFVESICNPPTSRSRDGNGPKQWMLRYRAAATRGIAARVNSTQRNRNSIGPETFKLKLLKEVHQRSAARKVSCVAARKAAALDPHAHRFAAPHNSPAPRRRIGSFADRHHVVAPIESLNHRLRIIADDAAAGTEFADLG
jgi:hypothetical protein